MPPRGGDKIRKVSSKRQDAMLAQMQKESEEVRVIEQMTFVMEEMKLDATVADSCHSIAVKAKKEGNPIRCSTGITTRCCASQ